MLFFMDSSIYPSAEDLKTSILRALLIRLLGSYISNFETLRRNGMILVHSGGGLRISIYIQVINSFIRLIKKNKWLLNISLCLVNFNSDYSITFLNIFNFYIIQFQLDCRL